VEYKPYKIAIPAKWIFTGLVQGLSKKQVQELRSLRAENIDLTISQYSPLHVFFDQFRLKKYLKDDIAPLNPNKISMILILLFFWLSFLIFLVATPLAYYLKQPQWMVDSFCMIGLVLLIIAIGFTFYDRSRKRGFRSDFLDGPLEGSSDGPKSSSGGSISFPDLNDGEGIIVLLIIILAILLAMFFFVFIWLPILFVILNIITLGSIEDRYRTIEITLKKPEKKVIDWLATKIIFSGGYLSSNWDPWITNKGILHTAIRTREEHRTFINTTIIFAIVSFIFAFILVIYRIFEDMSLLYSAKIVGLVVLAIFVYLLYLVVQGRIERKQLFNNLYNIDTNFQK
jgi:hypothetical protein